MRFAKLVSLWALAAAPVILATPCTTGTLASYIALGSSGCANGLVNVEDFTFTVFSDNNVPITPNNINVTPMVTANSFGLQFSSPCPLPTSSESPQPCFNVSGTNVIDVQIGYSWDPEDLSSLREVMNDPPVFPGVSQITIDACENAFFTTGKCPTTADRALLFDNQQTRILSATIIFPPGVTSLGMRDTIFLAGNGTGSADIISFSDTVATPEPATLLLIPAGAGVLFAWRRRTRARGHFGQPFL
jgi:hypothetical protein